MHDSKFFSRPDTPGKSDAAQFQRTLRRKKHAPDARIWQTVAQQPDADCQPVRQRRRHMVAENRTSGTSMLRPHFYRPLFLPPYFCRILHHALNREIGRNCTMHQQPRICRPRIDWAYRDAETNAQRDQRIFFAA